MPVLSYRSSGSSATGVARIKQKMSSEISALINYHSTTWWKLYTHICSFEPLVSSPRYYPKPIPTCYQCDNCHEIFTNECQLEQHIETYPSVWGLWHFFYSYFELKLPQTKRTQTYSQKIISVETKSKFAESFRWDFMFSEIFLFVWMVWTTACQIG